MAQVVSAGRMVSFAGKDLDEIPAQMIRGRDITHLDLSGNRLSAVPEWISDQVELRVLKLQSNLLTTLPPSLGTLRQLAVLDLSDNQLVDLPGRLGALRRLRELRVNRNRLDRIPAVVADLLALRVLRLGGNAIVELPDLVGGLDELVVLDLADNQLRSVAPDLGRLGNLHLLDLSNNRLTDLPGEVGGLNLTDISLARNRLTVLPASVTRLTGLNTLNLAENQLDNLPDELGSLMNLTVLDVSGNRLTRLPAGLARLPRDIQLRLETNPWEEPLPALVNGSTDRLFVYLRSLEHAEPQYEAKLLLVGEGAVGKTSLVAALRDEPFIDGRATTHGIERHTLTLPHQSLTEAELTLNAWDFGGQEVYRITHQFFFSERALYLVVWTPRQGQEQNEVAGWLRRIRLRVNDVKIIIVATHCDERNPELDLPDLQARFGNALVGSAEVDSRSGAGIGALRDRLAETAARLPQMGEPLSIRWAAARRRLRQAETAQIRWAEFAEICASEGLDPDEATTLAHLLHDLGHTIHYADDDGLRDLVVLQPEWLTKAIGYVLEDVPTRAAGGALDHHRLHEIWSREGAAYPAELFPYFLRLMEKFDVSYRLRDEDGFLDESLVAQLVPYIRPTLPWDAEAPTDAIPHLTLVCELSDEAPGLVAWLTVRNHRHTTGLHWRHGVYLEDPRDSSTALFVLETPTRLALTVRGPSPVHFFGRLVDSVETLIIKRWPGLRYEFHVPCPGQADQDLGPCPGTFRLAALERRRARGLARVECQECFRSYDVLKLLTGFPAPAARLQPQLDRMQQTLNEIASDANGLGRKMDALRGGVRRLEAHTAQIAAELRTVLKITAAEVNDCPRLFTFTPTRRTGIRWLRRWEDSYQLTLWCEESSGIHAWEEATYTVDRLPDWLATLAPYASLVVSSLRLLLPVTGVIGELLLSDKAAKDLSDKIDQMTKIVESDQLAAVNDYLNRRPGAADGISTTGETPSGLTPAQGAGLRTLRTVLFELDPTRTFGGMHRIIDPTGDFLWVCPDHYPLYDPGLPNLPNSP